MKLILLGTGGYFPTSRRHTACLMLPEIGVVLDAGSGMCRIGKYLQTISLDIFLTHAHLDHVAGLTYLVNLGARGSAGSHDRARRRSEAARRTRTFVRRGDFSRRPAVSFCAAWQVRVLYPMAAQLEHFPLKHPGRLARLSTRMARTLDGVRDRYDGRASMPNYVRSIRGVDLLVHESYFAEDIDNMPANTGHSSLLHGR